MNVASSRSFASVLDELLNAGPGDASDSSAATRPSIPVDMLGVASPVDAFWSSVSDEFVAGLYLDVAEERARIDSAELPTVRADDIATELSLDRTPSKNLDRLRRSFAFKNHPDRVAPELRERAILRMQIANGLIDEAKRKAKATP